MTKTLCATGHRPQDLWGYNLSHAGYLRLSAALEGLLLQAYERDFRTFISGGALGVDTLFARAVLSLREQKSDIKLVMAIPFAGQERKWPPASQASYKGLLESADTLYLVDKGQEISLADLSELQEEKPYYQVAQALLERNKWMVDQSDAVIAVHNGKTSGGTYHCLQYALSNYKMVINYHPFTEEIVKLSPKEKSL